MTSAGRVALRCSPIGLRGPYSASSTMLATIVGSANGRSISALTKRLPGNSSRTSTHATSVPATTLTSATISEIPTVSTSAARAAGAEIASHRPATPLSSERVATAASGSRTMTLSHSVATPSPSGPTPPTAAGRRPPPPRRMPAPGKCAALAMAC